MLGVELAGVVVVVVPGLGHDEVGPVVSPPIEARPWLHQASRTRRMKLETLVPEAVRTKADALAPSCRRMRPCQWRSC